jgi:hypothetical protein
MKDIRKYNKFSRSLIFAILILSISVTCASAATSLKVDLVKYEPYPAEIGQYVTVWIKVENVGYSRADDVSVELVPSYPFSLDTKDQAVQNIGILPNEQGAVFEYKLYVDENAKTGVRSIEVRYQDNKETGWMKQEFDIRVGSDTFDSKGTLQLEQVVTEPDVLKPGDTGTVTLTLKNSATQYTISIDGKEYDTNARVRSAALSSSNDIIVTSDTYHETGILGPGDTIDLTYNIIVADDAKDETNHLEFNVMGSSHSYNTNWYIPIKVDSSGIKIIPTKPLRLEGEKVTIEFDVVNTHPGTLSSVSVKPQAEGIEFSPAEYFIGSMDHDELFTVEFDATVVSDNDSTSKDLIITAQYKNGYNQHEDMIDDLILTIVPDKPKSGNEMTIFGILGAIVVVSSLIIYRRKKQQQ